MTEMENQVGEILKDEPPKTPQDCPGTPVTVPTTNTKKHLTTSSSTSSAGLWEFVDDDVGQNDKPVPLEDLLKSPLFQCSQREIGYFYQFNVWTIKDIHEFNLQEHFNNVDVYALAQDPEYISFVQKLYVLGCFIAIIIPNLSQDEQNDLPDDKDKTARFIGKHRAIFTEEMCAQLIGPGRQHIKEEVNDLMRAAILKGGSITTQRSRGDTQQSQNSQVSQNFQDLKSSKDNQTSDKENLPMQEIRPQSTRVATTPGTEPTPAALPVRPVKSASPLMARSLNLSQPDPVAVKRPDPVSVISEPSVTQSLPSQDNNRVERDTTGLPLDLIGTNPNTNFLNDDLPVTPILPAKLTQQQIDDLRRTNILNPGQEEVLARMNLQLGKGYYRKDWKTNKFQTSLKWSKRDFQSFTAMKRTFLAHFLQTDMYYIVQVDFMKKYERLGPNIYKTMDLGGRVATDIIRDSTAMYGALLGVSKNNLRETILLKFEHSPFGNYRDRSSEFDNFPDGILTWKEYLDNYDEMGSKAVYTTELIKITTTPFTEQSKSLIDWLDDLEGAYAELTIATNESSSDQSKIINTLQLMGKHKREWWYQEIQNFTYQAAMNHIRHQIMMAQGGKQIKPTHRKVNRIAIAPQSQQHSQTQNDFEAMINAIRRINTQSWNILPQRIQDLVRSVREKDNGFTCGLPKEVWDMQTDEEKREYKEKWEALPKDQDKPFKMPSQYSKSNNTVVIEQLEEDEDELVDSEDDSDDEDECESHVSSICSSVIHAVKNWNIEFEYPDKHPVRTLQVSVNRENIRVFNSSQGTYISIMDSGADTSVIGQGWYILKVDNFRKVNVIGFDADRSKKLGLHIVVAVTAVDLSDGQTILLQIAEAAFNPASTHSLLSEYQLRDYGCKIDSVSIKHGGNQQFLPTGSKDKIIPLSVKAALLHFKNRYPTKEELENIEPIPITCEDVPWKPATFEDDNKGVDPEALYKQSNSLINVTSTIHKHDKELEDIQEDEFEDAIEYSEDDYVDYQDPDTGETVTLKYYDPSDKIPAKVMYGKAVHLNIDKSIFVRQGELDQFI